MENVLEHLEKRGFIAQTTAEKLKSHLNEPTNVYVGFDPTAESLHLGNLLGIIALKWFQKFGHTPYVVLGGATGRIGDPSGKSLERPLIEEETLRSHLKKIEAFFHKIFPSSEGLPSPVFLNNDNWLRHLSVVDFLRDVGKHFRMGPMLGKESVRLRISSEEGMSFTEFSYQILQGFDFFHLFQNHGVTLQMGGSDQWGNITAGIEFTRKLTGESVYGLTWPLLVRSDGKKFGKTEGGAVWLSSENLSPYDFYQYLYRVPDKDVIYLMKMLTFMPLEEIEKIEKEMTLARYLPNTAQKRLAEEVTLFVHGKQGVEAAQKVTEQIHPGAEAKLDAEFFKTVGADMPQISLEFDQVIGKKFVEVAVEAEVVSSKSEASRLIKNGGAYVNNERLSDVSFSFAKEDLIEGTFLLLGMGKKKKILVKVIPS